jgi:hypothetical protein
VGPGVREVVIRQADWVVGDAAFQGWLEEQAQGRPIRHRRGRPAKATIELGRISTQDQDLNDLGVTDHPLMSNRLTCCWLRQPRYSQRGMVQNGLVSGNRADPQRSGLFDRFAAGFVG